MSALSDQLKQDHDDMRTMVAVLVEMANRFEEDERVAADDLEQLVEYMDTFVNRCHHAKEEQILFPALEESGMAREGGPLEIMTAEHQLESNFLTGMNDAVGRYANGDQNSGQAIAQYARDYAALLSRDMEQEDQLIYPLAEQQLSKSRQDEMTSQFEKIEREVLGPKRHEPYHEMAHQLAQRYLN
jgi:hemerythrin-like domain-containing protein